MCSFEIQTTCKDQDQYLGILLRVLQTPAMIMPTIKSRNNTFDMVTRNKLVGERDQG
jgi:hypothetical protein